MSSAASWRSLTAWMASHDGVVTRGEASGVGWTSRDLRRAVVGGELAELYPGVYVPAGAPRGPRLVMAAALRAGGPGALLSHRAAAWVRGWTAKPPPPEVVVAHGRRIPGLLVHRCRVERRRAVVAGLACTDAESTLIDCAAVCPAAEIPHLVDAALARGHVALPHLLRSARSQRRRGRPGPTRLLDDLAARGMVGGPTPSVLESRMARLLHRHGLPAPAAEVRWGPDGEYRLDFSFPGRVAVEVDGYVWHSSPEQLRRDHKRRNLLQQGGWVVLVFTWLDVTQDPAGVAAQITAALSARAA